MEHKHNKTLMVSKYKFYDWWFIRGAYSSSFIWVFILWYDFGIGIKNTKVKPINQSEYCILKIGQWTFFAIKPLNID